MIAQQYRLSDGVHHAGGEFSVIKGLIIPSLDRGKQSLLLSCWSFTMRIIHHSIPEFYSNLEGLYNIIHGLSEADIFTWPHEHLALTYLHSLFKVYQSSNQNIWKTHLKWQAPESTVRFQSFEDIINNTK